MEPADETTELLGNLGFTLRDYQHEPVDKIIANFEAAMSKPQWIAADRGWGKTYAGVYIAKYMYVKYGLQVLLISPPGEVQSTWVRLLTAAEVPFFTPLSWQSLSGKRGKEIGKDGDRPIHAEAKLSHKWLVRENEENGPFHATVEYQEALRNPGVLLIGDEFAAVKNATSARHWALVEMIQFGLACAGGTLRVLLLSALFGAEEKNYECLFRVLNTTNGETLMYKPNKKTNVNEWVGCGFGNVVEAAKGVNKVSTYHILDQAAIIRPCPPGTREDYKYRFVKKSMDTCLRLLWEQVLAPVYQPYTEDISYANAGGVEFKFVKRNGFFKLNEEEAAECQEAITALKKANIINDDKVDLAKANRSIALVQSALLKLAHAKTPEFLRQIIKKLRSHPTCKVIAIHPFIADQNWLAQNLKMYGAVQVNGKVKFADRSSNIALFNEPNTKCRVCIITPEAGGVGVSLHDHIEPKEDDFQGLTHLFKTPQDALFPRSMWAISNFNYLFMFQSYGRAYRSGMRSDVDLTVFYASNASIESVLVNTMMKSKVAKGSNLAKKREYPDEFAIYIDEETPEMAPLREFLEKMRAAGLQDVQKERGAL